MDITFCGLGSRRSPGTLEGTPIILLHMWENLLQVGDSAKVCQTNYFISTSALRTYSLSSSVRDTSWDRGGTEIAPALR